MDGWFRAAQKALQALTLCHCVCLNSIKALIALCWVYTETVDVVKYATATALTKMCL